jgi:hypothetical protein
MNPRGKEYPVHPASAPNQTHQADFVGPRHLKGPVRFYSLNSVDIMTGRCAVQPLSARSGQSIIDGFCAIWIRIGIPGNLQVDNEMCFWGSPRYPRGMGPLIRLYLHPYHHIHGTVGSLVARPITRLQPHKNRACQFLDTRLKPFVSCLSATGSTTSNLRQGTLLW